NPLVDYRVNSWISVGSPTEPRYMRRSRIRRDSSLREVIRSFDSTSDFWTKQIPQKDAVICVVAEGALRDLEGLESAALMRWRSSSIGPGYYLRWEEEDRTISQ